MDFYYLGIDVGTGSTKAVVYNRLGKVLFKTGSHYSLETSEPGFFELDPEKIWKAFVECLESVMNNMGSKPQCIGLSTAMHGVVLVSPQGTLLTPIITWADIRSESIAEEIMQSSMAEEVYRTTGTPIHSMSPLCKIIWLKRNRPDLFNQAVYILSIKSFLWYRIFERFEEDWSIASATGLFDIHTFQWSGLALNLAGIEENQLPLPVATTFYRSEIRSKDLQGLGLSSPLPICIGASDGCTASLGSFCLDAGTSSITIGTSGAVRACIKKPVFHFPSMIFNYILDKEYWVTGGPVNNGGLALDWGIKTFSPSHLDKEEGLHWAFQEMMKLKNGSEGLLFLPYLTGERAPIWDGKSSGVYLGIKRMHGPAHFLKALLEGICYALNEVMLLLENQLGEFQQVHISGGFTQSPLWVQTLSNITGKKLVMIQVEDSSTLGAMVLAMKSQGFIEDFKEMKASEPDAIYYPDPEAHERYRKIFQIYVQVYPSLKKPLHELFALGAR